MRTLGTAVILAVLATSAGCGERGGSGTDATGFDDCAGKGSVVARADLDADGTAEALRLVSGGPGDCAGSLVARLGDTVAGVDVSGLDLVPKPATTVHLSGDSAPDLVLVAARPHPRGGSQPHLFGAGGDGGLTEVTADGNPVVPFVATDGGAAPMNVTCT